MATVGGDWDCVAETPMGEQRFVLTIRPEGDGFTGSISGALGSAEIEDGNIEGDRLHWGMSVSRPLPIRLICEAKVSGDRIDGGVIAGGFGTFPVTGTRRR